MARMPYSRRLMDRGGGEEEEAPPWSEDWNQHHHHNHHPGSVGNANQVLIIAGLVAFVAILAVIGAIVVIFIFVRRSQRRHAKLFSTTTNTDSTKVRRFSYGELKLATHNFSERNKLGQGGFSTVYKGLLKDGRQVAVKRLDSNSSRLECEFWNEITVVRLAGAKSLHVVPLLGFCHHGDSHRLLVYEFMSNGSLQEALFADSDSGSVSGSGCSSVTLGWERRFRIAVDTAKALAFLHSECNPPVVHGDVKPSNVLLDGQFGARVADFGLARLKTETDTVAANDRYVAQLALAKAKRRRKLNQKLDSPLTSSSSTSTGCSSGSMTSKDSVVSSSVSPSSDASCSELLLQERAAIISKEEFGGDCKTGVDPSVDGINKTENCKNRDRMKGSPAMSKEEEPESGDGDDDKITVDLSVNGRNGEGNGGGGCKETESAIGSAMEYTLKEEDIESNNSNSIKAATTVKAYVMEWLGDATARKEKPKPKELDEEQQVAVVLSELDCDRHSQDAKTVSKGVNNGHVKECRQWWKEEDMAESRKNVSGARKSTSSASMDWWKEEVSGGGRRRRERSASNGSSSTPSTRGTICYVAPEYGSGGGPLSEKSDVYSFGVLLLVIISGRRPLQVNVSSPLTEFERGNLVSWARHLAHSGGPLLDLVDASIAAEFPSDQALLCIQVALLCLRRSPAARPTMNEVVEFLSQGGTQTSPTITPSPSPTPFFPL